jgi:superfamily II DNA or RNA helicase
MPGDLRAVAKAKIDLLPHQLTPAFAAITGKGCRFLLADEVGLGKTIQAGAIAAELRARGAADRVLILTPPGLREQWAQELSDRFDLQAAIVDFRAMRERVATLRPRTNPWTTWTTVIASVDYVKRPEVLREIAAVSWDVVIVDEAHRVANDGDRHDAVAALASQAGYVVLLTATPHNGDSQAFDSLCQLGSHGDRLLIFRRTRQALASAVERRVHRLLVRASLEERRLHAHLDVFAEAVRAERGDGNRDAWIALAVLRKRAFSSAHALHLSIARRLEALRPSQETASQLLLPLHDQGELDHADEPPAWQAVLALKDVGMERRLLTAVASAAAAAAARETKLRAIRRLLARIGEPVIVFTEYRDTLAHVARTIREPVAVLHGGLSRQDRRAALDAFSSGRRRVLLATDAAGEGLNLHDFCRVVINLELPWNPMRLEQRIGRVDRIGQRRTVHAFHLIAAGTGEERLLAELRERIRHAQTEIGAPNPFGDDGLVQPDFPIPDDVPDVSSEVAHLRALRAVAPAGGHSSSPSREGRALTIDARHPHTRRLLNGRALHLWEVCVEDRCGRALASTLVPLALSPSALTIGLSDLAALVEHASTRWRLDLLEGRRVFVETRLTRERAIGSSIASSKRPGIQPGLFDRRVAHAFATIEALRTGISDAIAERAAQIESRRAVEPVRIRLSLLMRP